MRKISFVGLILLALTVLAWPSGASAQLAVGVSVHIGPPALPVYAQPICPGPGYLWTPGYWAYGDEGYYWVPGTWVIAPTPGFLWTPGYWGWGGGVYVWHAGYWGPHVGFYGGINYGFGYGGVGFVGGRWSGGVFHYNTAVMNVNTTVIHNTYIDRTVVVHNNSHVAFNGGSGGVRAEPTREERSYEHEHHVAATSMQTHHEHEASSNRALRASENHGRPSIAATAKPGEFNGHGVVAAREAHTVSNGNRPGNNAAAMHSADRPPSHGNNGNSNAFHPNNTQANNGHVNNAHMNNAVNSPRNPQQPRMENKPHAENKPENKPHEGGKPHLR
jgi:YXWGXW repeat-containing protein